MPLESSQSGSSSRTWRLQGGWWHLVQRSSLGCLMYDREPFFPGTHHAPTSPGLAGLEIQLRGGELYRWRPSRARSSPEPDPADWHLDALKLKGCAEPTLHLGDTTDAHETRAPVPVSPVNCRDEGRGVQVLSCS